MWYRFFFFVFLLLGYPGTGRVRLSPDAGAVGTLAEELGEGRGKVTLDTAAVDMLEVALSVAQVARRGEYPSVTLYLPGQRSHAHKEKRIRLTEGGFKVQPVGL